MTIHHTCGLCYTSITENGCGCRNYSPNYKPLVEFDVAPQTNVADHFDAGKPRLDLLPSEALEAVAGVLAYGASKYSEFNWRKGMLWRKLLGSTLRHLFQWARGQDLDAESGLNHLAHASCDALMLLTYVVTVTGEDNRYKKP